MNAHGKTNPVRAKRRRSHHPPRPALTLPGASSLPAAPIRPPASTLATAFALAAVVLLAAIAAPARSERSRRGLRGRARHPCSTHPLRRSRGESLLQCEDCGAEIPEGRREALRGVRLCVGCQGERDRHDATHAGYNRRGSKDSQLR